MEVVVDGEHNFAIVGSPTNVLAAVSAASKYLRERGRAIVSVKIDGVDVPYAQLGDEMGEQALEDVARLEIESEEISTLVAEALDELDQALPDLPQACRELAAVFQSDQPQEGYDPFTRLADIWRHIKQRQLQVVRALDVALGECELHGKTVDALHQELNEFLEEAVEAVEKLDTVLLADLLEYELAPRAESELAIVTLLRERAARPPA